MRTKIFGLMVAIAASLLVLGCPNPTTPEVTDTAVPTPGNSGGLSITGVGTTSLTVNWTAATDTVSAAAALEYLAYVSTADNIATVEAAEANGTALGSYAAGITSHTESGAQVGETYYFNVIVKDEAGNKAAYTSTSQTNVRTATMVLPHDVFDSNAGGTTSSLLYSPNGVLAIGNNIYVADYWNGRVVRFNGAVDGSGDKVADLVLGADDFTTQNLNDGTLSSVYKLASNGSVLAAATGKNKVLLWNSLPSANNTAADVTITTGSTATSVLISGTKLLLIDSSNGLYVYNSIPTASGTAADTATFKISGFDGPLGMWTDGTRLVVSDSGSNRVLIWNTFPTAATNTTTADLVLGQANFIDTGANRGNATPSQNSLSSPRDVVVDSHGTMYIVDSGNHRIVSYTQWPTTNGQAADGIIGQSSWTTNATGVSATSFYNPRGLSVDSEDHLWVADGGNNRVLRF